jgi:hypothetical protein
MKVEVEGYVTEVEVEATRSGSPKSRSPPWGWGRRGRGGGRGVGHRGRGHRLEAEVGAEVEVTEVEVTTLRPRSARARMAKSKAVWWLGMRIRSEGRVFLFEGAVGCNLGAVRGMWCYPIVKWRALIRITSKDSRRSEIHKLHTYKP